MIEGKKILFLFVILNLIIPLKLTAQAHLLTEMHENYHYVRLYFNDRFNFDSASSMGIVSEGCEINRNWLECILNDYELNEARNKNIKFEILQDDLEHYYESILIKSEVVSGVTPDTGYQKILTGTNFTYGSMGG
jgi:hypothetical protein